MELLTDGRLTGDVTCRIMVLQAGAVFVDESREMPEKTPPLLPAGSPAESMEEA